MLSVAVHRCDVAGSKVGGDAGCLAEKAIRQEHLELCAGMGPN